MVYASLFALVVIFIGQGEAYLFYNTTDKVIATNHHQARIIFKANFTSQTKYDFISVYVRVHRTSVATGGSSRFVPEEKTVFGNRISARRFNEQYILTLVDVNFEDTNDFVANVFYLAKTAPVNAPPLRLTTSIALEVIGAPEVDPKDKLPLTTNLNTTGPSQIHVFISGNPKPTVSWHNGDVPLTGASQLVAGYKARYKYYATLPNVTPSMCGNEIKFVASGHGGSIAQGTTKINMLFAPTTSITWSYRVNSSCMRVMWQGVDIGSCTGLIYHVDYLNATGSPISTTNTSHPHSEHTYCHSHLTNINFTRIRASFNGHLGDWSSENNVLLSDPNDSKDTQTGKQTSSNDDDWRWKAIVGGVVGGFFFILFLIIIIYCCCCGMCAAWCTCCHCSACCGKEEKEESGVTNANSLGFQYKKNSKKKTKSVKVVIDKDTSNNTYRSTPAPVVPVDNEPVVIYAHAQKTGDETSGEIKYFDPMEFDMEPERPTTLKSNYTNSTYDYGDDDTVSENKPSFLI